MEKEKKNHLIIEGYDYLARAASTTDCTGLIPTPATSEEERDAYKSIYPFLPPKNNQ